MTEDQAQARANVLNKMAKHPRLSYAPTKLRNGSKEYIAIGQFYDKSLVGIV